MVVEESPEEEEEAEAEVAVVDADVVVVDLTLIHNKLLHNSSNSNNNSSGLVKCQDNRVAVTGNATKSTAAKRRLIALRHVLILRPISHQGLITQILPLLLLRNHDGQMLQQ